MSSSPSPSAAVVPAVAAAAVLAQSEEMPEGSVAVRGYDFEAGVDLRALLDSYRTTGFQVRGRRRD